MKYHGLIFVALSSVSSVAYAQNTLPSSTQEALPIAPSVTDSANAEPLPLPNAATPLTQAPLSGIDAELQQFRNELRNFQSIREDVARAAKSVDGEVDRSSSQQRQELLNLLSKLAKKIEAKKAASSAEPALPAIPFPPMMEEDDPEPPSMSKKGSTFEFSEPSSESDEAGQPKEPVDTADAFALGKVLFRNGDFVGAENAFRKAAVSPENEMTLKYLLATCLRRQSQWKPAIDAYKAVAESNQDPVLRDLAKWQIDNIRWHQQSETQLEFLRKQREKKSEPKKNAAATTNRVKR